MHSKTTCFCERVTNIAPFCDQSIYYCCMIDFFLLRSKGYFTKQINLVNKGLSERYRKLHRVTESHKVLSKGDCSKVAS